MTLTIKQIYNRYSVRSFKRIIEVKRRKTDGSYEENWQNIETLSAIKLGDDSVSNISYSLPNNSYNFGIVNVGNLQMSLISKNGQFDDEENPNSIFNGFLRHKSLIRVRDGYIDKYSSLNPVAILTTVFEGFIDETSTGTKVDKYNVIQDLQCTDLLSFLLKEYTIADIGSLSSTDLNSLIYEILNRELFTSFFNVSPDNINAGYNITDFDISKYEAQTTLFSLFESFSLGHSFFYVKNGNFYYQSVITGNQTDLEIAKNKIIEFAAYDNGISSVFEKLYWEEDITVGFTSPIIKYNKSKTINIEGVTNPVQRQNLLNFIGGITKRQYKIVNLKIPYYMDIFILDKISVQIPEIIPKNAFIWGVSKWGQAKWQLPIRADNISTSTNWLVRQITHANFTTTLKLQELI